MAAERHGSLFITDTTDMSRILAIDFGRRRCGVAVTDPLQISANALPAVRTCDLLQFLTEYCAREDVERILMGEPRTMSGEESESIRTAV